MITNENCSLSPQATCLLINLSTYQLPLRGIPHFTPLPMGEGSGEGLSFFLQQALSKYRVLNILLVFEYEASNDSTQ